MQVTYLNDTFVCRCSFEERETPKRAGFRWSADHKQWFTNDIKIAVRLREHFDTAANSKFCQSVITVKPWAGPLYVQKGFNLFDYQIEAVRYSLARNRSYLGLDMGLGKTPIAATIANALLLPDNKIGVVYICPPHLTRNTLAEFEKWAPMLKATAFSKLEPEPISKDMLVLPDTQLVQGEKTLLQLINLWRAGNRETILIVDEAHRFKNLAAKRTINALSLVKFFDRVIFMSGTPMPNSPIELYPILSTAAPSTIDFMNRFDYGRKYCAAHKNQWGWDFSGASNMKELAQRVVGPFMCRMKKEDVLKELPPKIQEMVVLSDDLPPKMGALDQKILDHHSPVDLMKGQLELKLGSDILHLATYRRELGIAKAPLAIEHIEYLLEESEESVIVFAIHKEVVRLLAEGLEDFKPLVVTGDTDMKVRHEYVKEFQGVADRRLFIGNIQAAGTGITLTKASRVVFAEFAWTPSDNDQAADRAHRIGQRSTVWVQYLVYRNSVDAAVVKTILEKQKVINKFYDQKPIPDQGLNQGDKR